MEADAQTLAGSSLQGSRGSADVHAGLGRGYQLPLRFRAKRERSRQFHKEATAREEMNLNHLLAARHTLPIPFPLSPGPTGPISLGRGGMLMFPAANGHMISKMGLYKEPLLPSAPPPLLQHHGGLNLGPLAFAHHANVKAAVHAMSMLSPNRNDLEFKRPPGFPKPAHSVVDMHKVCIHSRSESASSVGSLGAVHDASLKKLMKDLHRCEVSISRYQAMLNEHCDAGLRFLHQAFITLHIGLNAREKDLARELQMTRQTAGTILQHRHSTACVLRQLAERTGELEEAQLHELKKQIKQFVTDRKVDEEIGTTSRFIADPDDLLPHIMSFGRVVNRRHVYTSWEGDPASAVENSKHNNRSSVFSSPTSSLPTTPSPPDTDEHMAATKSSSQESFDQKLDDSVFKTPDQESTDDVDDGRGSEEQRADLDPLERGEEENTEADEVPSGAGLVDCSDQSVAPLIHDSEKRVDEDKPDSPGSLPTSSLSTPITTPSTANPGTAVKPSTAAPTHKGRPPFSRKFAAPVVVTHTRRSFTKPLPKNLDPKSTVTLLLSSSLQQKHKHKNQKTFKRQFSPLYHFSDGALEDSTSNARELRLKGREKERELWRKRFNSSNSSRELGRSSESGEEGGRMKHSPEELSAIQSRVRESLRAQGVFLYDPVTGAVPINKKRAESIDTGMGKSETNSDSKIAVDLKKTPTQLRRERKKRQKERERRQELERRALEDGGGEKRGRVSILEKTSANPSPSTSRTTSPLSSIGNNTLDTRLESVSLSLSQSPPPPTEGAAGEQRSRPRGVDEDRNLQSTDTIALGTCNCTSTEIAMQNKATREDQQPEMRTVETSTVSVKKDEVPPPSDSASIEWDMSQRRQERAVDDGSLLSKPESATQRERMQETNRDRETVNGYKVINAEVSSSQHANPESYFSTAVIHSHNSLNLGTSHNHSSNPPSSSHPCNCHTVETHASIPLLPSALSSSVHNKFSQSQTSDTHILEPHLPGKRIVCLGSRLNGDSGQSIVMNGHEE